MPLSVRELSRAQLAPLMRLSAGIQCNPGGRYIDVPQGPFADGQFICGRACPVVTALLRSPVSSATQDNILRPVNSATYAAVIEKGHCVWQ